MKSHFSASYFEARERFRESANRLRWELAALPLSAAGPSGQELTIDVAISSSDGPASTLLVTSGLHGVEGFFGSAIQLAAMERMLSTPGMPANTRVVMVHAVNPFGYAHLRRVNEENIDLNRNFLLQGEQYTGSMSGYQTLNSLLNPASPPPAFEAVRLKFGLAILRHGMHALKNAIPVGQYDFPKGLFFGGSQPSESMNLLATHLPNWLGTAKRVLHLDLHTGLGKNGECHLVADEIPGANEMTELKQWFGSTNIQAADPAGVTYRARGSFGPWVASLTPAASCRYLLAEFGGYPVLDVLAGLRKENRAFHWSDDIALKETAGRELLELFAPSDASWREQTVSKGTDLVLSAVAGLSAA